MASTTTTTRARHLSFAQGREFRKAEPGTIVTVGKGKFGAIAADMGVNPGAYVVGSYVIKSGTNEGKASVVLIPADVDALKAAAQAATEAAAQWVDPEWVKAQGKAAQERADKAQALLATVKAARKAGKGPGKAGK